MLMPESDSQLNEYGALVFADIVGNQHFYRVPASEGTTMLPMSYCFTAYDAKTFENLPLANDRIEIVVMGLPADIVGIEGLTQTPSPNTQHPTPTYNLQGQKVGDSYRGIIIRNGRKMIRR